MASIHKRGQRWRVRWRDLDGNPKSHSCPDHATAKVVQREIERAKARQVNWRADRSQPVPTLREALAAYLTAKAHRLAYQTLRRMNYQLDLAVRFAEQSTDDPPLTILSLGFLRRYAAWLRLPETREDGKGDGPRPPRSESTVAATVRSLEVAWKWLDGAEMYDPRHVPRPRRLDLGPRRRGGSEDRRPPTWDEWDAMLRELREAAWRYRSRPPEGVPWDWVVRLALLARYTAGRRTALLQVRWGEHFDLDGRRLHIPAALRKGAYGSRTTPLHPALVEEAAGWGQRSGTVVAAPAAELHGRGHADRSIRKAWRRAGVPEAVWKGRPLHCARHTWETWLIGRGEGVETASLLLGHAVPGTGGQAYLSRQVALAARWEHLKTVVGAAPPVDWGKADGERLRVVQ